jgi:mono/diheme cytochrome c family protein
MRRLTIAATCTALLACAGPSDAPDNDRAFTFAAGGPEAPFPLTPMQQEGRIIFETMCWTCHGSAGRGDGPAVRAGSIPAPPSFHASGYAESTSEDLLQRFNLGLTGADPAHPHMQYVSRILRPERFVEALAFIPALSYPREIPGSALAGERLYDSRCAGCHGIEGRGDGLAAAALLLTPPADFSRDSLIAARDWEGVFRKIREGGRDVHGSSMPASALELSVEETWDVVAFLGTFQPGAFAPPAWAQ